MKDVTDLEKICIKKLQALKKASKKVVKRNVAQVQSNR